MIHRICLALTVVCIFAGCAIQQNPKDELIYQSQDFAKRVAWKDYSHAALHFEKEYKEGFISQFSDADLLNIVDISVVSVGDSGDGQADIEYRISYYKLPSTRLIKTAITLPWEHVTVGNGKIKEWRITSPFPDINIATKN